MDEKFIKRFNSFQRSLDALAEERDLADSFVLSGTGAKFSITFDLAWKVMKNNCHRIVDNYIDIFYQFREKAEVLLNILDAD